MKSCFALFALVAIAFVPAQSWADPSGAAPAAHGTPCVSPASATPIAPATTDTWKKVADAIPVLGLRLSVGTFSGLEPTVQLTKNKNVNVALEGFYGAAGLSPGYGGGARVEFRTNGEKNFLLVAPGVDVYVSPPDSSYLGHSDDQLYVVPNVDVAWLHQFAQRFGIELGARGGYGFATDVQQGGLRTSATVGAFAGLRF